MGDASPSERVTTLRQRVQELDESAPDDLFHRADARRVLGGALLDSGDLAASTAALDDAIGLLRSTSPLPDDLALVLALSFRTAALTADAAHLGEKAAAARQQAIDLASQLVATNPRNGTGVYFVVSDDLRAAQSQTWREPIDALTARAPTLDPAPALQVFLALNEHWRSLKDADSARRVILDAQRRVAALDDAALSSHFVLVHDVAFWSLYSDAVDGARSIIDRLSHIADSAKPADVYAVKRLQGLAAHLTGSPDAVELTRAAYDLASKTFGNEDKRTRISQRELAEALDKAGQFDDAITTYSEVLEIEQRVGKEPLTTAEIAWILGKLLDEQSRFEESCETQWIAFTLRRQALGPSHPTTNLSRSEVAELSRVLGRVDEAEFLFRQALDIETRLHGPQTEQGALIRNNLGETYAMAGQYAAARACIDEALAIRVKAFGDDSPKAWRSRSSLAMLAMRSGDAAQAVTLARAALEHEELAANPTWHIVLGSGLVEQGLYDEAERAYRRVYDAVPKDEIGRGISLQVYLGLVTDLATCRVAREDWAGTVAAATDILPTVRDELPGVIQRSAEVQLTGFARILLDLQSLWLWSLSRLATQTPEQLGAAFELVQLTKGLRTRYLRWRQPGVGNVDSIDLPGVEESLKKRLTRMRTLQDDLTASLLAAADDAGAAEPLERVQMRAELRQIERQLAEGIGYSEMALADAPSASLSELPEKAVAIELLVVRDIPADRRGDSAAAHRYMAFVIGAGSPKLRLIELGLCDELDQAITGMRDSLVSEAWTDDAPPPAWRRLSRFLGSRVLTPIEKDIAAATHVLIAPDGLMGALPFEILMMPDGEYLIDRVKGRVSYLMRFGELGRAHEVFTKGSMPLVLAGPDFDLPKATVGKRGSLDGTDRLLTRALGGAHFVDLSGARAEGVAVAKLLGVEPLVGVWALAPELRRNTSPEIIHLSTHGFSLPFKDAEVSASLAAPLGNALDRRVVLEDPMQRSGLAMSGANAVLDGHAIPPEAGAGRVFAADIQQLNLQRTDLVVLSACRSGLGDISIGDGAHGLRRAFLAAGARSVVSALWDVPDDSSKTLITHFYQRLLQQATRVEALADARNVVRDSHPRDPVHWAGFVLDGYFGELARFSALSDLKVAQVSFKSWVKGKDDAEGMAKLAQRLVSGAESDADEMLSALSLRTAISKPGLPEDTRIFVLEQLGDLANRLGDNDNAVAWYREILATKSLPQERRPRLSYVVAKILQQMGRTDESIAAYTDVLTQAPSAVVKARTLANRGLAYLVKGEYADGITDFTAVIENADSPEDQKFLARMNRAAGLAGLNQPALALDDINAALASGQASATETLKLRVLKAEMLIDAGREHEALDEIASLEQNAAQLSDALGARLAKLREQAKQEA